MNAFIFILIHIYFVTILAQPESLIPRPRDHDFHHVVREVHRYHNHALSLYLIVKKGKQNEIKMEKTGPLRFLNASGLSK